MSCAQLTFACIIFTETSGLLWTIIKPSNTVVGGLRFYRDFFYFYVYLLFSSFTPELAERNSTKIGHMLGGGCDLKIYAYVRSVPPTFVTTSQLNGNFNGLL